MAPSQKIACQTTSSIAGVLSLLAYSARASTVVNHVLKSTQRHLPHLKTHILYIHHQMVTYLYLPLSLFVWEPKSIQIFKGKLLKTIFNP